MWGCSLDQQGNKRQIQNKSLGNPNKFYTGKSLSSNTRLITSMCLFTEAWIVVSITFKFPACCSLQTSDTRTSTSKDLGSLPPAREKREAWEISKQQTEKALQGKGDRSLYRTRAGQVCKHLHSYKLWEHSRCNQQDLLNTLNMRLVLTYLA